MNTKRFCTLLTAGLLMAGSPAIAQDALRAGFVEGADVMFYVDMDAINQSEFGGQVEAQQSAEIKAEQKAKTRAFTDATGLTEDDMNTLVFSMDLEGIDFASNDPAQLEDARAMMAVNVKKALTLEQVKAGLQAMAGETGDETNMSIMTVDGMEVLKIEPKNARKGPDGAYATLSPDGETVLLSFNAPSLKQALARVSGGEMAAPGEEMGEAIKSIGQRHVRAAVVLPPEARQKIQEGVQAGAAQGGMGAMLMPFSTTRSLLVSANTSDSLDLYLSLDLGNNANATQAAGMLQSMVPMVMMQFGQQLGPKAMEISQKIKIAPKDTMVTMGLNLTPGDVKVEMPAGQ